jgi:outer membrane protein OmpA-like peptidoglycan-associated protein
MKKLAFAVVLGMSMMACRAQVRVQAAAAPEPVAAPAPAPPPPAPEPPKVGEQLTLPEQIEFEVAESRILQTPKTLATLEQLAETMKTHPNITKLRIEGHTDNAGKAKRNEKLSKARAEAVAQWLAQHDVAASRLVTIGFGAKRPLVANDSADHRAMNRRTEYYVEELDGKKVDAEPQSQKVASGTASASGGGKTTN